MFLNIEKPNKPAFLSVSRISFWKYLISNVHRHFINKSTNTKALHLILLPVTVDSIILRLR